MKKRVLSLMLSLLLIVSLFPIPALAADSVTVLETASGGSTLYTVQISSSGSLKNTKIVAERARDAGYNAFVYHPADTPRYKIMIGLFSSKSDALSFADDVNEGPEIRGADVGDAFVATVKLGKSSIRTFSEPYLSKSDTISGGSSKSSDSDIPVILGTKGTVKGVAIQVASSGSESSCRTCIKRLREAGYNAYIYQPKENSHYKIMIGFFDDKYDAAYPLEEVTTGPEVKGVKMSHGFLVNVTLTKSQAADYGDYLW